MLQTVFLGHQSWLLSDGETNVLVDPVLLDYVGDRETGFCDVYPPRRIRFEDVPPLSAVVLTHEHPDHFDIASLARIDRGVPVYLSARSSVAARTILAEMGFEVRPLVPRTELTIGTLDVDVSRSFGWTQRFEWDVLPILVRDRRGGGSFFSAIDLTESPEMHARVRARIAKPGVWTAAVNDMDFTCLQIGGSASADPTASKAADWSSFYERTFSKWTWPPVMIVYGGGYSFGGDLAWLNAHCFHIDLARLCALLEERHPGVRFVPALPGERVELDGGAVSRVDTHPCVELAPRASWPIHHARGDVEIPSAGPLPFTPVRGRTELDDAERAALSAELDRLAHYLYGSEEFQALYQLGRDETNGREATFAFSLCTSRSGARWVVAYRPESCRFETVSTERPAEQFLAGAECWATDLLDFLRIEHSPGYVLGRSRQWSHAPDRFAFSVESLLFTYAHALHFPEAFLAIYRRVWERESARDASQPRPRVRASR